MHFGVPRWHLVTPILADKHRYSVYGWVLTPNVKLIESEDQFSALVKQLRAVALCNFPPGADARIHHGNLGAAYGAAAHQPGVTGYCYLSFDTNTVLTCRHMRLAHEVIIYSFVAANLINRMVCNFTLMARKLGLLTKQQN